MEVSEGWREEVEREEEEGEEGERQGVGFAIACRYGPSGGRVPRVLALKRGAVWINQS